MSILVLGSDSHENGPQSSLTHSTTMPSGGSNTLIALVVHLELGATVTPSPTWNTTETFTQASVVDTGGADNTEIWYLVNPTVGLHDVVINFSTSNDHMIGEIFLAGVDCDNPIGSTPAGVFGTGTTDDIVFTPNFENSLMVDGASWGDQDPVLTPTAPQIKQYEISGSGGGPSSSKVTGSASTRVLTQKVSYTNTYTSTESFNYSYLGVEFKESPNGNGFLVPNGLMLMGVGQ